MSLDHPPRIASAADAAHLAGLLHAFNTEFDTESPGPAVLDARLRALLTHPAALLAVAGRPGVGFALVTIRPTVWFDGAVATLDELYVQPPLRSRGVGSALLGFVLDGLVERGVAYVEIPVDEGDADALRFYSRFGFRSGDAATGERELYLHRGLPR